IAGLFSISRDIRFPFSNTWQITRLLDEIPAGGKPVTDYWTMNAVVAFTDRPIYCVDVRQKMSFVLFDRRLAEVDHNPHRYTDGLIPIFQKDKTAKIYLITLS